MKSTFDSQNALRKYLATEFQKRKEKDHKFSYRSFARELMINQAPLTEFLRGRRNLSIKAAKTLLGKLGAPESVSENILALFDNRLIAKSKKKERVQLSLEEFSAICEWQHFAILSLLETRSFRSDVGWIARRLGISHELASQSIERLIRSGLLSKGRDGELLLTGKQFSSPDGIKNEAVRITHRNHLKLSESALSDVPMELRNFSSVTMAIDPSRLKRAAEMIQKFRRRLSQYLEGGKKMEVYALDLNLFPLSKGAEK